MAGEGQGGRAARLAELFDAVDWSSTALGARADWPESLRTAVSIALGSRFPAMIFWGPELVQLYNDAYAPLIGNKHPAALGQTAEECFPEIWDVIGPMLRGVRATGVATWSEDQLHLLERGDGVAEAGYFTYSFGPAGTDPIEGIFCTAVETTGRVIGDRRLAVLRDLGTSLAGLASAAEIFETAVAVLGRHPEDLPGGRLRVLDGAHAGLDLGWPAGGGDLDVDRLTRATLTAGRLVVEDGTGGPYRRGHPAVAGAAIDQPGATGPVAVLAMALNDHIPFDLDYADFVARVAAAISAAHTVAEGYEAAARRTRILEELDQAKTAFLSNVSHEFRTPLTLLLAPIEEYQRDDRVPPEIRSGLAMAERNARRVLKLVNSLLDMSRLEAGRVAATFQPTDLVALTADLVSLFRAAADAAGVELRYEPAALGEPVYVDRELWEQIVTNLCANALKFTSAGSIGVRLSSLDGSARLEITDTGAGISAEDLPLIFDRFRRGQSSGTAAGTGLGLALTRELVELHGGSITVTSQPGRGSTFVVTIPTGTAHLDPAQVLSAGAVAPRTLSSSAAEVVPAGGTSEAILPAYATAPGSAATVWVVEDNPDMRVYLTRLLSPQWNVESFGDAESALGRTDGDRPDLILSDVMLPGLSGLDLLAALRADPASADIPVVLLSARAGEEATVEGLRAGADDYLIKPFTARELIGRISSNLHLARMRRDIGVRARRHAARLDALASAATQIVSAETLEEIAAVVQRAASEMTGVAAQLVLTEPDPAAAPAGDGVMVPLRRADGTVLGRLSLRSTPQARTADDDLTLVEQLAHIASQRIDNLARYRREHRISHTLQRSLLPAALPQPANAELVARYRASTAATEVGGDWYDAVMLPDGRLMVTVGDVAGHDVAAAVTMGQIRLLLRSRAADSGSPAELCATVNGLLPAVGRATLTTMIVAFVDLTTGRATLVNAGHPAPIRCAHGQAELLDLPPALPLGVSADATYQDVEVPLPAGSTLWLYTDGLLERRDEPMRVSREKLLRAVADLDAAPLAAAIDALVDASATDAVDDIAVLALRRPDRPAD